MNIIYLISKIITSPGAFMKGFWEHITCRLLKIDLLSRGYLQNNDYCGHAEHSLAKSAPKAFLTAFLPWLFQNVLALAFLGASVLPILVFGIRGAGESSFFWPQILFLFLGLSMLCNAYPHYDDALQNWGLFYHRDALLYAQGEITEEDRPAINPVPPIARVLFAPINALFMLGAWLEKTGLSVLLCFGCAILAFALR
ncbi:MAG: hypothetical protein LBB67_02640 [Oscillospiraceae bacterium]|jgi:hypothetical protein|nr:hypothetical protein [Oscillospiraceae bacterium]